MGSTLPVTVALATGRSYSCTVGAEASISVITLNGTQLWKWVPDSTSAQVTRQRCLGVPTSRENCTQPQGCSCGQDQRCTVWFQEHATDVSPNLANIRVFQTSSGALATSISYSLFSTDSAPTLLALASNNLEFTGIDRYLGSLLTVNTTVLGILLNDTNLSLVGNTDVKCATNETAPGDPSLPTWSGMRSCNAGIRNVTQWLLHNRSAVQSSVMLQFADVLWDIFPTNISVLSYFLIVGSPLSVINAEADAYSSHANDQLATVRAEELDRVTATGTATKEYLAAVETQVTLVSQAMETQFIEELKELENTSMEVINASQRRSSSQVQQLMEEQTSDIEAMTSKHLSAMLVAIGVIIAVVCAILLIVLLCSAWGTAHVTRDLIGIIGLMESVADLKVEDLVVRCNSRVTEVARIESAFQVLVRRLTEYKSYIPASVFEKVAPEETGDDGHNQSDGDAFSDSDSQLHIATIKHRRHTQSDVSGVTLVQGSTSSEARSTAASSPAGHCTYTKSRAAVLTFHAFNLTEALLQMAPSLAKNVMCQVVAHMHEAATQSRGNIDCILGDQAFITFNTHIPCAEPAGAAVAAALDIRRLLCPFARDRLRFQIGISCGPVLASSIGYSKFRTMVTLGHPMKISSMVSQMSDFESGTVLVDTSVEEKMKYMYDLRPVELVHFPQLKPLPWNTHSTDRIFLVEGKRVMDEDEWLYQVDKMASPNDWHWAFDQVASAQTAQEGRSFLEQFLQVHPHDAVALRLKAHLAMWIPGIGLPLWERAEHDR
eukprot:GGOE01030461.1.p1 GENE.GGOE01030461.1~~GGOE01030461.1.p1  ORF type:complete len:775 (-),score=172.49 GGOE01030461.1:785-3109(-)